MAVVSLVASMGYSLSAWWPLLVECALKGFILLCLAALVAWAFKRQSAAVRHFVWTAGIVAILALPLLATALPTWRILPAEWAIAQERSIANEPTQPGAVLFPVDTATRTQFPVPKAKSSANVAFPAASSRTDGRAQDVNTGSTATNHNQPSRSHGTDVNLLGIEADAVLPRDGEFTNRIFSSINWTQIEAWLITIWLFGAAVVLCRIVLGQLMLVWLSRTGATAISSTRVAAELQRLRRSMGIRRPVRLLERTDASTPMAWGVLFPCMLLPSGAELWNDARLRSVLLHELAHITRWDCATQLLARLATAVYWFNPLVWFASQRMRVEREQACDDRVLAAGTAAADYARHLLEVTAVGRPSRLLDAAAVGIGRRSQLESRIQAVLDRRRSRGPLSALRTTILLAAAGVVVIGLGTAGAAVHIVAPVIDDSELLSGVANPADAKPQPPLLPPRWQLISKNLRGHVTSLAWSPDGRYVAFGEADVVRIHDALSLELMAALVGHTANVRSVAWSPEGTSLASGADDQTVRVWSAEGKPLAVFSGHALGVNDVAWSPNGKHIASAGKDGTVRICAADGSAESLYREHRANVHCVAWSPDGVHLASGDDSQMLHIWQAEGSRSISLAGDSGPVVAVAWSPDGSQVAAVGKGRADFQNLSPVTSTVSLWSADGTAGAVVRSQRGEIQDVAWSPDGRSFASAGDDGSIWLWKGDGTPLKVMNGGNRDVSTIAWSPDGSRIAVGSRNVLHIVGRDGASNAVLSNARDFVQSVAWSNDGNQIVVGCEDGTVRMFGADRTASWVNKVSGTPVHSVAWSPDGQTLAAGAGDGTIALIERDGRAASPRRSLSTGRTFPCEIAWSPDGKTIAAGCFDKSVLLIDLTSGKRSVLRGHKGIVHSVAWSPDGKWLASAGFDSAVQLWTPDGTAVARFERHDGEVNEVAWSPDGKRLAAGDLHAVRVWNLDGTAGPVLPAGDVIDVRWSPDGKKIAAASWEGTVQVWQSDGTPGLVFAEHSAPVVALDWSRDSRHLATGSYDSTLRVFDANSGEGEWAAYLVDGGHSLIVDDAQRRVKGYTRLVDRDFRFAVADAQGPTALVEYADFRKRFAPGEQQ